MPLFDSLFKLKRDNTKVDTTGLLHVIVVREYVRDDETKYYQPVCLGQDLEPASYDTHDAAKEAGDDHMSAVTPAPSEPTVSSIVRRR